MPWRETNPMKQRKEFIDKFLTGRWTMTELTDRFGISRVTGYKWWNRFKEKGLDGLTELSRAPHSCPHRTPPEIEEELVAFRKRYPKWGPETLLELVRRKHPDWQAPGLFDGRRDPQAPWIGQTAQAKKSTSTSRPTVCGYGRAQRRLGG